MAVAAGCFARARPAVEPVALADTPGTAGSLVLRRMDRRGYTKRGLVQARKHGTKSGTGAPLRRGFPFDYMAFECVLLDIQSY